MMKKTMIALAALTLAIAFTGCSDSSATNNDSAAETTTVVTGTEITDVTADTQTATETADTTAVTAAESDTETAAESETAAAETVTTAAEEGTQAAAAVDEAKLADVVMQLLDEYMQINYISGMGLDANTEESYQPENSEMPYHPVTDPKYQSIADLKAKVEKSMTGALKDEFENIMFDPKDPIFIEHDGKLYMRTGGTGWMYDFQKDTIKFSDVTDKGFKATILNKTYGDELAEIALTVECIDGKYYLSAYDPA